MRMILAALLLSVALPCRADTIDDYIVRQMRELRPPDDADGNAPVSTHAGRRGALG
jgi:hypothetical protein